MSDGGFDVHDLRHRLKLKKDGGDKQLFENRDGVACPACGRAFDAVLVSEERHNSFGAPGGPFCVSRKADRLLVFRH